MSVRVGAFYSPIVRRQRPRKLGIAPPLSKYQGCAKQVASQLLPCANPAKPGTHLDGWHVALTKELHFRQCSAEDLAFFSVIISPLQAPNFDGCTRSATLLETLSRTQALYGQLRDGMTHAT